VTGSTEDSTELIYRYEEKVFDRDDPSSLNLASMIAVQVALNYGLFCREIVFRGPFDKHDRRLLREMAANTAREIFVKKLLEPNPFILPEWELPEPVKLESYLQARLVFPDSDPRPIPSWRTDWSRHAILSSGGKESLLSYGLLDELGYETHPIFVNESGRHWFTALNAHRHFSAQVQHTARVWTSSDRLFNWMLRHLPFVRQDFSSVRSDEYPIRLWTVAVFLFGILPLAKKRGIGRIVIGDEFDTTRRAFHKRIPHFDGLYDQSRYFDSRLTSYFQRKGWGTSQFSIVRPLSELLVLKILVERYPELQRLQVSCHAAHTEGDHVRPCGRCEKCRRVVGMLRALGADPTRCGYTADQVNACLRDLASEGVHQEAAGARQLLHMLLQRGLLPKDVKITGRVKSHPEVLKIRVDRERSPMSGVPVDLRRGLFQVFLDHAQGVVQRTGRVWVPIHPLDDPELYSPYRFESAEGDGDSAAHLTNTRRGHLLAELSWPQAEQRFREVDVALLPIGAIEQHGPHLPLDTDAFDADYLARRVAEVCSEPRPIVLPLVPYGVSYHHDDFAGTISVTNESLSQLVYDIGMSCARNGVSKLVIVNGHGGNTATLQFAAQMINRDANIFTCVDTGETSNVDLDELCETRNDVHAGEIETSTSLAIRPDLVDMEKAEAFVPEFSSRYLDFTVKRSVEWYARTSRISSNGVLGDPGRASAEKGARIWEIMIANLVELVEELKGMTLDEIYERRY
jgi:creatinine amidohydrolase/Fe(II)-dependent formamide hydrolase-like protein